MNIQPLVDFDTKWSVRRPLVLCDIDGCCIDPEERVRNLLHGDYEGYVAGHSNDKPIVAGWLVYGLLISHPDVQVVFCTARQEDQRAITEGQLSQHFGEADFWLWMNPSEVYLNNGSDAKIKLGLLEAHGYKPEDVVLAFDDRPSIVEAYRKVGITTYQTAVGY
jgi:hypothetical protein